MLKGLDPLLSADLLHALRAMGHGDEIAVVDANFPAASNARRLIRLDGTNTPRVLAAILSVMPIDRFVDDPVKVMAVVGGGSAGPPEVVDEIGAVTAANTAGMWVRMVALERDAFYERARAAYAIVATGERRFYGNVIVTKGVLDPAGKVATPEDARA
jgi:L-fucose mutarotase